MDQEKRNEITQDMVLKELSKIGFADVTDFVTIESKGSYKAAKDKQCAVCMAAIPLLIACKTTQKPKLASGRCLYQCLYTLF